MNFDFEKLNYDCLLDALEIIKKGKGIDDYVGSIYVGELQVALFIRKGFGGNSIIKFEVYVGGVDTGYGYTTEGNLPYDFAGSAMLVNSMNVKLFEPYEAFEKKTKSVLEEFFNNSTYINDGVTLSQKAMSKATFNWD